MLCGLRDSDFVPTAGNHARHGKGGIRFHPDVKTNDTIMGWMADEFARIERRQVPAAITGKPLGLGGARGRTAAYTQAIGRIADAMAHQGTQEYFNGASG